MGTSKPFDYLFPFQQEDVTKLLNQQLPSYLIADEMGTGKTYQAVVLDYELRKHKQNVTLVVAPLAVHKMWQQVYESITNLSVKTVERKRHNELLDEDADVYIIHWEVLHLCPELKNINWHLVIADEAHKIKSRKAKRTKSIKELHTNNKIALTGTPADNIPADLWSILHWLYPKTYTSYWKFYDKYVDYEIVGPPGRQWREVRGARNVTELRNEIQQFAKRRTKGSVVPDLPNKYYTEYYIDLHDKQRRAYDGMRNEMLAWVGQNENEPMIAPLTLVKLTRLQQLAVSYMDNNNAMIEPSTKIQTLDELIEGTDNQIVVFSRFRKAVDLAYKCLANKHKIGTFDTSGCTTKFQNKHIQVLLATLGAGSEGVNFSTASTVVFLDRSWAPRVNKQAEDRLHRMGQTKPVQVIDLIAKNTVDMGRKQSLERKWSWVKSLLDVNTMNMENS
jgi:SNF2 family DNA or RNA helicase